MFTAPHWMHHLKPSGLGGAVKPGEEKDDSDNESMKQWMTGNGVYRRASTITGLEAVPSENGRIPPAGSALDWRPLGFFCCIIEDDSSSFLNTVSSSLQPFELLVEQWKSWFPRQNSGQLSLHLHCTLLHWIVLYYTALHCTALHCTVS